jgi:hypothetical protein
MKSSHFAALQLLLATPSASVFAQAASQPSPALSHAQVKAETREAIRVADFEVGDAGRKAYEVDPSRYPKRLTVPGQTRAQVKQETRAAISAGDVQVGETGETLAQENPSRYAGSPAVPPKLHLQQKRSPPASSAATASD